MNTYVGEIGGGGPNGNLYAVTVNDTWDYTQVLSRTTDGGKHWENLNPFLPFKTGQRMDELFVNPYNPEHFYLTGWFYNKATPPMIESRDGGHTWRPMPRDYTAVTFDPVNPDTVYFAGRQATYRSTDGGLSLTKIAGAPYTGRVVVDQYNPNTLYLMNYSFLYKSTDAGNTFHSVTPPQVYCHDCDTDLLPKSMTPLPQPGSYLMTTYYYELFRTYDAGINWELMKIPEPDYDVCRYYRHCYPSVYASDLNHYFLLFETDKIMETLDAGATWSRIPSPLVSWEMTDPRLGPIRVATDHSGIIQASNQPGHAANAGDDAGSMTDSEKFKRWEQIRWKNLDASFGSLPVRFTRHP